MRVENCKADLVVVDGDALAFRSAAANEKRKIVVIHKLTKKRQKFDNRTAFKKFLEEKGGKWKLDDFDIDDVQEAGDVSFALHSIKNTLQNIFDAAGTSNCIIYLGGDGNFRLNIPLPSQYKSNRDNAIRPIQLAECREYLVTHWGAEIVEGKESDDMFSYWAFRGEKEKKVYVCATPDKDGRGYTGFVYNWVKPEEGVIRVEGLGDVYDTPQGVKGYGQKFFAFQTLFGDASDGYKPTELAGVRYGEKSALKDLAPCSTLKEVWEVVAKRYKEWYPSPVTYTAWNGETHTKSWIEILEMYLHCVHMWRKENDYINPVSMFNKLGINYE